MRGGKDRLSLLMNRSWGLKVPIIALDADGLPPLLAQACQP